jgi:hypothetical protein
VIQTLNHFETLTFHDALILTFPLLSGVIGLLVILGQGIMTGKVVSAGKTKLVDWTSPSLKFFFTVLGISIVFGLLHQLLIQLSLPFYEVARANFYSSQRLLIGSLLLLLTVAIPQIFFLVWLGSATLSGRGILRSLIDTVRTLRHSLTVFGEFVLLCFVVQDFIDLVPGYVFTGEPLVSSLSTSGVIRGILGAVLSPLWFLMAFELYHTQNTESVSDSSGALFSHLCI